MNVSGNRGNGGVVPGGAGVAVRPGQSDMVMVKVWEKWHLPIDLEHTRCGRSILRPVRLEVRARNERHLCRHCARQ